MFLNFKKEFFRHNLWLFLSILIIVITFWVGFYIGQRKAQTFETFSEKREGTVLNKEVVPEYLSKDVDFNHFWRIWNILKVKYLRQTVSDIDMFYGAIAGMVASLGDPYSVFFEPKTAEKFTKELAGEFEGIGAEIGIKQNRLTIIAPLMDSPAERAGLMAGDKVYAIDGVDTRGITLEEAVSKIRGPGGTQVVLTIMREGFEKPRDFTITRDKIIIKSVEWRMIDEDIAIIRIVQFNEDTIGDFEKVVRAVIIKNPRGIILDLRNNPGGFLDSAVDVAEEWLPKNKVVVLESFGQEGIREHRSKGKARLADFKTVVLVNGGSASGSEIVAGALADYGKAQIVGEKTFGKGSVQHYEQFPDGSALKLTIAEWLTPNGRAINEEGIEPDILVELTEEDFAAGRDPQLDKAIELLKS